MCNCIGDSTMLQLKFWLRLCMLHNHNLLHIYFFPSADSQKSLCAEPKPVSVFKNNQFKEKAQENELEEQQS